MYLSKNDLIFSLWEIRTFEIFCHASRKRKLVGVCARTLHVSRDCTYPSFRTKTTIMHVHAQMYIHEYKRISTVQCVRVDITYILETLEIS